jgi:mannose-6-phosphate isomerase
VEFVQTCGRGYSVPVTLEHDRRPWGEYTVLDDTEAFKVKRITVLPGKRLSLQRHERRQEHWFVVAGEGCITLDDREFTLGPGGAVDIPLGAVHRIANPGSALLTFIEVQQGEYFGEDDIVRLEDDYGRVDEVR